MPLYVAEPRCNRQEVAKFANDANRWTIVYHLLF
jgi:hypothetical protein